MGKEEVVKDLVTRLTESESEEEAMYMVDLILNVASNMLGVFLAQRLSKVCDCVKCRDSTHDFMTQSVDTFEESVIKTINNNMEANNTTPLYSKKEPDVEPSVNEQTCKDILKEMEEHGNETEN